MVIHGRDIADEIKTRLIEEVRALPRAPRLALIVTTRDFATERFLAVKRRWAGELGVVLEEIDLGMDATVETICVAIEELSEKHDGIIVQLPLPPGVSVEQVIEVIPRTHDVDVLSQKATHAFVQKQTAVLPPVVGAFAAILQKQEVSCRDARVVVVGNGRLVGRPAALWFAREGAQVTVVEEDEDLPEHTKTADIVVLGAGVPGLLKPEMVKKEVVILDAGTSESAGKLSGDADPACAEKAALFTPVPGGVGPITIAMLFQNLLVLMRERGING